MTRRYTLTDIISAAALIAALALLGNCHSAAAVERWPRRQDAPQEQRIRPASPTPTPDGAGGLGCDMRRRYSATSCDPNNRPATPRGGAR